MKRFVLSAVLIAFVAVIGSTDASAQSVDPHSGIWLGAGVGYGALGCDGCGDREGSLSGQLAVGGTMSDELLVGVGLNVWTDSENDATLTAGLLTAQARVYAVRGLYFTGGLGIGRLSSDFDGLGGDGATGFGVMLGVGYDFRVGPNVSITPYAAGYSIETDPINVTVYHAGIGVTIH